MQVLIALFALLVVAAADHHYKVKTVSDLEEYRNDCVKKHNIDADTLEKYKKWNFPDDEGTHKYIQCVFEKFGFYDDDKGFVVNDIHHQLVGHHDHGHDDDTHKTIEKCAEDAKTGDKSTWAYKGLTCLIKNNLQLVKQSFKQ